MQGGIHCSVTVIDIRAKMNIAVTSNPGRPVKKVNVHRIGKLYRLSRENAVGQCGPNYLRRPVRIVSEQIFG